MKRLRLEIDGLTAEGRAVFHKGALWLHLDGETFVYEDETSAPRARRRGADKAAYAGEIAAPMPGKIVKVMAKPGDEVSAGQVLVVMEAMKMEYTLKALAGGRVAEVKTRAGDQVALGQNLLRLDVEPAAES